MAHSAATGSAKRTVNVIGKRLGIKKFGGESVNPGDIIVRQRGSEFYPGVNVKQGRDFTIYATVAGVVKFRRMNGYKRQQKFIDVVEMEASVSVAKASKTTEIDTMASTEVVEVKPKKIAKPVAKKVAKAKAE